MGRSSTKTVINLGRINSRETDRSSGCCARQSPSRRHNFRVFVLQPRQHLGLQLADVDEQFGGVGLEGVTSAVVLERVPLLPAPVEGVGGAPVRPTRSPDDLHANARGKGGDRLVRGDQRHPERGGRRQNLPVARIAVRPTEGRSRPGDVRRHRQHREPRGENPETLWGRQDRADGSQLKTEDGNRSAEIKAEDGIPQLKPIPEHRDFRLWARDGGEADSADEVLIPIVDHRTGQHCGTEAVQQRDRNIPMETDRLGAD